MNKEASRINAFAEAAFGERMAGNWLYEIYSDATLPTPPPAVMHPFHLADLQAENDARRYARDTLTP